MSTELGRLECYLCSEEVGLSDSLRFIRFGWMTQMFHASCHDVIAEMIEEKRKEIKNNEAHNNEIRV